MQQGQSWDSERIRRLRDAAGSTQRDLAAVLQVHTKTIAAAEGGRKPIPQRCEAWLDVLERAVAAYEPIRHDMWEASVARAEDSLDANATPMEPWRLYRYLRFEYGAYPAPSFWYGAFSLLLQQRHEER
jgi:transcriptional regulator with XRE-family HTH domain